MLYASHFQSEAAMGDFFHGGYGLLDSEYDAITPPSAASDEVHQLTAAIGSDLQDHKSIKPKAKKSGSSSSSSSTSAEDEDDDLRRGPWTVEEDHVLVSYITANGEGRWNSLARSAGLRRTGKSCRLRWLNYLRPDVRRGNITPEEQLLILELHSRWGNRWSKIAQYLPGRTDNEIKNYWRTRVQKHAKQLQCDVNSQRFKDLMRHLWMPRLVERIQASAAAEAAANGGNNGNSAAAYLAVPLPQATHGLHLNGTHFNVDMQQCVPTVGAACPEDSAGGNSSTITVTSDQSKLTATSHMQQQQQQQSFMLSSPAPASSDMSYYAPTGTATNADYSATAASGWYGDYVMPDAPQPPSQQQQQTQFMQGYPQAPSVAPCSDPSGPGYFNTFNGELPDFDQLNTPSATAGFNWNSVMEDMLNDDIWCSSLQQQHQQYRSF